MPRHAVSVLRLIRGWSNTDPAGPTALEINRCFLGRKEARAGLSWLKAHRIVSWTDEGNSRTRYKEATVPRRPR